MFDIDLIPAPVIKVKYDGTIVQANPSAEASFRQKLSGIFIGDLIEGMDKKFIAKISEKKPVQIEAVVQDETFMFTISKDARTRSCYIFCNNITTIRNTQKALSLSEARFSAIGSAAQDGIIMIDNNQTIIYWNNAAQRLFGYTAEEAYGKKVHQLIALPRYQGSAQYGFKHFMKSGTGILIGKVTELEGRTKSGEEIPLELSLDGIESEDGWYGVAILRDVSIRRKYEDDLRNQQKNLKKEVSKRTRELEKITKEMEETQLALTYLMEDVNEAREEIGKANLQLINEIEERLVKEKEIKAKTNELNVSLREVESARDKIDGILKSIADGLIVTDLENKIVLINEVAQRLFMVGQRSAINMPLSHIIKDKKIRDDFIYAQSKLENGYGFDFQLFTRSNKNPRTFSAVVSNIRNKKAEAVGAITIFRDVTEQKKLEQMKTEFISTSAHELRTPLTSIQGFAEILLTRDNLFPFEKQKFLNYILNQAKRLGRIIGNLLDISRIESGQGIILQKEPCFIGEMIRRIVSNFDPESKDHIFIIEIQAESENLLADVEKIEQVIVNLIANAVKYTPKGREIRLTARPLVNEYQVEVKDQGVGMTPEQVEKVFEKFYRADTSNTAVDGTGLGMSIVKNNIEAHGGKIMVESKYRVGTKVTFTLPNGPE